MKIHKTFDHSVIDCKSSDIDEHSAILKEMSDHRWELVSVIEGSFGFRFYFKQEYLFEDQDPAFPNDCED